MVTVYRVTARLSERWITDTDGTRQTARLGSDVQLLERSEHLDRLQALLEEASSGRGRLVFVGGEAGVGKTALIDWFVQRAERNSRVLRGACDSLATPRPLGALLDMEPQFVTHTSNGPAVFRAFLDEVGSARTQSLAVFEDVHWADQATLDLLRFVGRRVGRVRALVVATYRDDELGRLHPLRILLGDLATQSAVHRMSLAPLSREAVSLLARGTGIDAAHLYRRTGGNPFFVTEVLLSDLEGIPATVRDAVLARAARLPVATRNVLDAAAVSGFRVEMWLLETVVGVAAPRVAECVESGFLRRDGPAVAFRHELARAAIEEAVDVSKSVTLHRGVLRALRARQETEADSARVAYHAEAAGDGAAVLHYALEAARRAANMGAHREAAAEFGRALRFADGLDQDARARVLEARAFECFVSDQLDLALEDWQAALAVRRQVGDRVLEGSNLRWLARVHWVAGRAKEADEAATAAIEVLEAIPPSAELAMAYTQRGNLCVLMFRNQEALDWCSRAAGLLTRFDDVEARVHATIVTGLAPHRVGRRRRLREGRGGHPHGRPRGPCRPCRARVFSLRADHSDPAPPLTHRKLVPVGPCLLRGARARRFSASPARHAFSLAAQSRPVAGSRGDGIGSPQRRCVL